MPYPNEALTEVCGILLDGWELSPEDISSLARDLPGECEGIIENRAEQAWLDRSPADDSTYRRDMIAAGRGHLLP